MILFDVATLLLHNDISLYTKLHVLPWMAVTWWEYIKRMATDEHPELSFVKKKKKNIFFQIY
jgi:hypothetical protein